MADRKRRYEDDHYRQGRRGDLQHRSSRPRYDDRPRNNSHGRYQGDRRYDRPRAEIEEGEVREPSPAVIPPPVAKAIPPPPPLEAPAKDEDLTDFELVMAEQQKSIDDVVAEKRRKRAEILAKYAGAQSGGDSSNAPSPAPTFSAAFTGLNSPAKRLRIDSPAADSLPPSPRPATLEPAVDGSVTPEIEAQQADTAFDLTKADRTEPSSNQIHATDEDVSAADYNPDEDRRLDDARQLQREGVNGDPVGVGQVGATAVVDPSGALQSLQDADEDGSEADVEGGVAAEEDDDDEDMFAIAPKTKPKHAKKNVKKNTAQTSAGGMVVIDRSNVAGGAQVDDQDDAEGYYRVILGELLDGGRYHVHSNLGKGMFSSVVRAKDLQDQGKEVAIKMIRSQETMFKAGQKEAGILWKLQESDPTDKKHIVKLFRTFEHRKHLCLVFESLSLNLREVVKRFGKDVGINLKAVRAYAHQMFLGLNHMRKANIMHADLKPDNLLVNENHSVLKISDLGSASDTSENAITPYLVSRFYRAPEIILGLPYDCALDMWSIGCTLYELYTGKILFPGRNNNQMLYHMQELKGRLPSKMSKKGQFGEMHFDEQGSFLLTEFNKSAGTESIKKVNVAVKPTLDLKSRLLSPAQTRRLTPDDSRMLNNFVDLLDRSLELDPTKRLSPKDALLHPFLR